VGCLLPQAHYQRLLYLVVQDGTHFDNTSGLPLAGAAALASSGPSTSSDATIEAHIIASTRPNKDREEDEDEEDNDDEEEEEEEEEDEEDDIVARLQEAIAAEGHMEGDFGHAVQASMRRHLLSMKLETGGENLSLRRQPGNAAIEETWKNQALAMSDEAPVGDDDVEDTDLATTLMANPEAMLVGDDESPGEEDTAGARHGSP
jgi:hypothetical protein